MKKGGELIMKTKSIITLGLVLAGLSLGGLTITNKAMAEEIETRHQSIITKLVEKFGLNQEEVEEVFEKIHQEIQSERLAQLEEGLNQAVEDGVITQEQKQTILEKHQEFMGAQGRHMSEMKQWLEEKGIDYRDLFKYTAGMSKGRGRFH